MRSEKVYLANRMHRPQLTDAQQQLKQRYQPKGPCLYCQAPTPEWLMEVPTEGQPLEFYHEACGYYQMVEPSA
jgi:hypothetical protein